MTPFDCNHDGTCDQVRLCCVDTEMTLTKQDATRIDAIGYDRREYLVKTEDGFCELRNVDGHCFFYDSESKLCKIYENRPDGCRYYPIVYDVKKKKCVVDKDCPSRETMSRNEIRKSCHKVRNLVERLIQEAKHNDGPC
ncbi:MAG: YkgJ family cysteine cluster protein [Candidatus Thorarchaeota archaeon]